MSEERIIEWYNHFHGDVMISFSGGKDSTVLAHLVHSMYPDVPLVFANTGLEYPEIQAFARKMGATFIRPKMRFDEVISKYGYPLISKEVAEAIHAARHIVNASPESLDFVERERESIAYGSDTQRPARDSETIQKQPRRKWADQKRDELQSVRYTHTVAEVTARIRKRMHDRFVRRVRRAREKLLR